MDSQKLRFCLPLNSNVSHTNNEGVMSIERINKEVVALVPGLSAFIVGVVLASLPLYILNG